MTVAVVGCGVIGRSWIRVFTRAGYPVRVFDVSPRAVEQALAWHAEAAARDGRGGTVPQGASTLAEALGGATWVQESGPETLPAKQALYAELDQGAPPEAILASSTSTLDMTEIARGLRGAGRCVVAHPVNPPHVVPAVDLLGGVATEPEVLARATDFLRAVGQTPVVLRRYVPGFLLNRMQAALVREAISLLDAGVADADAIDAVIRDGLGLRWALMGPFGVANTNADGGVREYFTRYGASFRWLMDDLGGTPSFDAATIERIGAGVDAMYPGVSHEDLRAWRDRMVERITTLKADDRP
ncbi:MAG: 3-hydroxyacyl-CoA dehydrogenase [Gemmatimonadetes bacterium]|nr:3-hydroxyacyl-CoA dehydrogenase [Gemmatimonadota bacterium]